MCLPLLADATSETRIGQSDLIVAVLLGLLLPALLARPSSLGSPASWPGSARSWARWSYFYAVFVFAAATFGYQMVERLIGPVKFREDARLGLAAAALVLLGMLAFAHLVPLANRPGRVVTRALYIAAAPCLGMFVGAAYGVSAIDKGTELGSVVLTLAVGCPLMLAVTGYGRAWPAVELSASPQTQRSPDGRRLWGLLVVVWLLVRRVSR